jgi:oxygen-dependent protoporphyrinogen oxidase
MYPLPDGFLLLAPTSLWPLVRSRALPSAGSSGWGSDLLIHGRARRSDGDESLGDFRAAGRLGQEALERVADPLASGIYTGRSRRAVGSPRRCRASPRW